MLPTNIQRWYCSPVKAEEPKLLRVSRAAHELGLHPLTVRKWIKAGKIAAIRVGNEARIPRSEIERLAGKTGGRVLVLYGRDRKSTRLNSSHVTTSRMPSSA